MSKIFSAVLTWSHACVSVIGYLDDKAQSVDVSVIFTIKKIKSANMTSVNSKKEQKMLAVNLSKKTHCKLNVF